MYYHYSIKHNEKTQSNQATNFKAMKVTWCATCLMFLYKAVTSRESNLLVQQAKQARQNFVDLPPHNSVPTSSVPEQECMQAAPAPDVLDYRKTPQTVHRAMCLFR